MCSNLTTFPITLGSYLHINVHENKFKRFFRRNWSEAQEAQIFSTSSYTIKVTINNTIVHVQLWESRVEPAKERKLPISICFYEQHQYPQKYILKKCKDEILRHRGTFDDMLLLLVGIKDENDQKTDINVDAEPQTQKPNVRFVEWSVNSRYEDFKWILEEFVGIALIKTYIDTACDLHEKNWLKQDEDRQMFSEDILINTTTWSLYSKSLFSMAALRFLDLSRIAIAYNEFFLNISQISSIDEGIIWKDIIWKNLSEWSHVPLKTGTENTDTLQYYSSLHFDTSSLSYKEIANSSTPGSQMSIFAPFDSYSYHTSQSLKGAECFLRSLVIWHWSDPKRLNLSQLISNFKLLHHLVIFRTTLDDATNLTFPTQLCETMKHLVLIGCQLTEVPQAVGSLIRLTVLNISLNRIHTLPRCLGNLKDLRTFLYEHCPIEFPPENVLKRPARDVIKYLQAFNPSDESVSHKEAKLIVVGQEGVGKSTLIKGMRRDKWFNDVKPADKTDGVDIQPLQLKGTRFLVYDLAGDVEYLNTHPLFLSSQCLHLVVFDMSQIVVGKGTRSVDQLCRLELWLQMIAAQNIKSYVIIVGTHADHPRITTEIVASIRKQIVELMEKYRDGHKEYFERCILCIEELLPHELKGIAGTTRDDVGISKSSFPHVLGYFEVSSITKHPPAMLSLTNKNLESLKTAVLTSSCLITNTEVGIPKAWLTFYDKISERQMTPTVDYSDIRIVAEESAVHSDMVDSMLRFFHSQGNFLWYEDIPEMKEMIITDPQWLSDQLRTLISYRPCVNAVCDGVLHTPSLSVVWPEMTEENRQKLLALFRSVGLCFSISDEEELFPCNLPIGWPDLLKWPSLPRKGENQTSLLFTFTFLPPTFFSKLIVEVNKKRASFPVDVEPLYFRFHILYAINDNNICDIHNHDSKEDAKSDATFHNVHYEVMPHKNTIKVSIRGPSPCCIVPDICSTIERFQGCHYPGITFQAHLICPLCEMDKVDVPSLFPLTSSNHERICPKSWQNVGSINDIRRGKYRRPKTEDTRRVVGETLEDYHCPKLFVVLPININCLSLKDRIVYSYLKDGYAVHLLCECPGQWHFVDSPGYRIAKPKEFLEKYGKHLCTVMKAIGKLGTPLRAIAAAEPLCKTGAAVASGAASIAKELDGFLENIFEKYPQLKSASYQGLGDLKTSSGLQRSELAKFLETVAEGREFGPLVFTYVDKCGEWLWLCKDHNNRFTVVNK